MNREGCRVRKNFYARTPFATLGEGLLIRRFTQFTVWSARVVVQFLRGRASTQKDQQPVSKAVT
jgi:hypothetical protein